MLLQDAGSMSLYVASKSGHVKTDHCTFSFVPD